MSKYKKIIQWNALFFIIHYMPFIVICFSEFNDERLYGFQFFLAAMGFAIRGTLEANFTIPWLLALHVVHIVVLELWLFNVVKAQTFMKVLTFATAFLASVPGNIILAILWSVLLRG